MKAVGLLGVFAASAILQGRRAKGGVCPLRAQVRMYSCFQEAVVSSVEYHMRPQVPECGLSTNSSRRGGRIRPRCLFPPPKADLVSQAQRRKHGMREGSAHFDMTEAAYECSGGKRTGRASPAGRAVELCDGSNVGQRGILQRLCDHAALVAQTARCTCSAYHMVGQMRSCTDHARRRR